MMAITLVTTVGASTANSYVSLAEFATYINNLFSKADRDKVIPLSDDDRSRALILSTSVLDRYVDWVGYVNNDTQSLAWPRAEAYNHNFQDIDSAIIPQFLKDYVCEVAIWLIKNSGDMPTDEAGQVSEIKVGSLSLVMNTDAGIAANEFLPKSVAESLMPVGVYTPGSPKSARSISLVRS